MIEGLPQKRQGIFWGLILVCHAYFFQIYPTFIPTNELSRLLLVSAVVDDHTFEIDNAMRRFARSEDESTFNGHTYSDKAIGVSLLGIVPYAVLRFVETTFHFRVSAAIALSWLHLITITIPSILFLSILSRYWRRLRPDSKLIPHFIFLVLFATIAFTYSVQFISHYLLGALLFCSFYCLDNYRLNPEKNATPASLLLAGAAAGVALTMEYPAVFPVALLCCYALWLLRKHPARLFYFAVPVAAFLFLMLAYNYAIFGTPFDVTYRHMTGRHLEQHAHGIVGVRIPTPEALWGLLFSRHHGLFFESPILLFCIPGLIFLMRAKETKLQAWLFAGISLSLLFVYGGFTYWIGGWAAGPRYLAPAIPFLMTAVFFFFTQAKIVQNSFARLAGITAGILSVVMILISTVTFPYPPDPIRDPHFFVFFPAALHDGFGYNLGWLFGFHGLATLVLFFTLIVITFAVATAPPGPMNIHPAKLKLPAVAALCAALLLTAGFLTSPIPDAREYYARGLIYAFLGKFEQASDDMNTALHKNPDTVLQRRIERTLFQLDRLMQEKPADGNHP